MIFCAILLLGLIPYGFAEPLQPDPVLELDDLQSARALSLQLRGIVPSAQEMNEIEADGGVDASRLDQWLSSEAFQEQVMRHHRSLFWNSSFANDLENKRLLFTANNTRRWMQFNWGLNQNVLTEDTGVRGSASEHGAVFRICCFDCRVALVC